MRCKRFLSICLAAMLVVALAACGSAPASSSSSQASSAASSAPASSTASSAAEAPEAELIELYPGGPKVAPMADRDDPITFTFFSRDANQAPADNEFTQKIEELTGVTIKMEFLVGDLFQKLGTMMAGNDYPDLVFLGDSLARLIEAEGVIPLEDKFPNYPNLWTLFDEGKLLKWATVDNGPGQGHVYSMPRSQQVRNSMVEPRTAYEAGIGFYVQQAVLADAGYPVIKTVDEYFTTLENYKEKNPTIDGIPTMGFELHMADWNDWQLRGAPGSLMGFGNQGEVFVNETTNPFTVESYHINQVAYDYYKRVNTAFNRGLIDPATFTRSKDEYYAAIASGAVLGFFDQQWFFRANGENPLRNDGKFDRTYVVMPVAAEGYVDNYIDVPNGRPDVTNGMAITINCKEPDRALAYFDYIMQRDIMDWLRWGVEGTDWVYSDDGKSKIYTPERRAIAQDPARNRDETGWAISSYAPKFNGLWNSDGMPTDAENSRYEFAAKMNPAEKEFYSHYNVQIPADILSTPKLNPQYYPVWNMMWPDDILVTKEAVRDLCEKWYPRIIMAKDDAEFDSLWTSFKGEYEALDLETYFTYIEEQIAVRMAK